MARFRSPVEREMPPAFREGEKVIDADVCRTKHPAYGWGWYVVDGDEPNLEKPVRFVDEDPEDKDDGSGWWVYAKDVK